MKKKKTMTKWERFKECEELADFYKRQMFWANELRRSYPKSSYYKLQLQLYEQRLNELDLELKDLYSYYVVYGEWWMKEHLAFPKLWGREDL